jgi:hypothetical protein
MRLFVHQLRFLVLIIRPFRAIMMVGLAGLFLSACQPNPASTATPLPPSPQPTHIVVTRTPIPPTPLPAALQDIYSHTWGLYFQYTFLDDPYYSELRYSGFANLTFDLTGDTSDTITGSVSMRGTATNPVCVAQDLDQKAFTAQIRGTLRIVSETRILADLTITPDDPNQETTLQRQCFNIGKVFQRSDSILWPSLRAVGKLKLIFPIQVGYSEKTVFDLSGPMQGLIHGRLQVEMSLQRS